MFWVKEIYMKTIWLYDIFLDGLCVGNQGDELFSTKEDATSDASEYISEQLSFEYERDADAFEIRAYEGRIYTKEQV